MTRAWIAPLGFVALQNVSQNCTVLVGDLEFENEDCKQENRNDNSFKVLIILDLLHSEKKYDISRVI